MCAPAHAGRTHIVHAGFSGLRIFVARKKGRRNLIGNCLVLPHDTIPSTLGTSEEKSTTAVILLQKDKKIETAHLQIAQADTRPKFAKELFSCRRTARFRDI